MTDNYITHNLYVLDENDDQDSIPILEYITNIIPHINTMAHIYIRPYRLTRKQLKQESIKTTLQTRGVTSLPSLVVFKPYHEVLTGVDDIRAFYNLLLSTIHTQENTKPPQSEPNIDTDPSELVNQFYQDEITGKEQERNGDEDISTDVQSRFRKAQTTRSGGNQGLNKRSQKGSMVEDNVDFSAPTKSKQEKNDPMDSVKKVCEGEEDNIEMSFYQNLLEV